MKYYKTLLILLFIISFGQLHGQEDMDDLLNEYKTASIDNKIALFYSFFSRIEAVDKDTIAYYVKDLNTEGLKNQREDAIAMSNLGMATYLQTNSLFEEANQKLNNAVKYYHKVNNDTMLAESYNALGNTAFLEGKFQVAEAFYIKSSEYALHSGDKRFQMLSLFNLARIDVDKGSFEKAHKKIEKYIDFQKNEEKSIKMMAAAYGLLGQLYLDQKMYAKAIENFTRSMEFGLTVGSLKTVANGYTNLAIVEYYTENYERSEQYFQLALAYRVKDGKNHYIAEGYYNLGDFYVGRNRLDSALVNYKKSFEFAELSHNLSTQKDALLQIEGVYETLKQESKQVEVLKKIVELQEKITEQQNLKGLTALRMSYDQSYTEAISIGGIREDELQSKVGAVESVFNNWVLFSILSLVGLFVFIFLIKKKSKK